jgi:N,N-dimethylformamidase
VRQELTSQNKHHETDDRIDTTVERNDGPVSFGEADLIIAAYDGGNPREKRYVKGHFNGKIDGPKLFGRVLADRELERLASGKKTVSRGLLASWDFSTNTQSTHIRDKSPNRLHGESVNFPVRAVTGHNWSGRELDFKRAPEEYDAIHFHEDSLGDAGWKADFTFTVPARMRSGIYAAKLTISDSEEDYVPFFVRPRKGTATSKIVFVVPTLSYLAYGDEHTLTKPETRIAMNITGMDYPKQSQDVYINEHGLHSLYDYYLDGAGVPYTSRLRPLVNMRPKYVMQSLNSAKGAPHQFNADLHLTDWLEQKGFEFDVVTDEDLHHEGVSVLKPYRVVLTGSHHEYWTTPMLDALETYLNDGGRMMYLGGNGFYWVTTVNPEKPWIFEVRRWGGTGSWMADPGEYHNSFTGEPGGIWRNRGRHPQKVVGVGFTAQGIDYGMPYKRQPGSFDPRAAFFFEGIGRDELIGDFPSLVLVRGAGGFELDRADPKLGTPSNALVLATSGGYSDNYQHVIEEVNLMDNKQGGTTHPLVKADLACVKYPKGGGVFSTGSISWCGSLSYNNYDNNVSRLMSNTLNRFLLEEPLP